jgi:hypothetical protein
LPELVEINPRLLVKGRTDYQLEHFVVGQHDTPEMRYHQLVIEARGLVRNIKITEIDLQIARKKIEKLEASGDEIKMLKAAKHRIGLTNLEETLVSQRKELECLVRLSQDYRHYTDDDIEANQPEYWRLRLTRQAMTDKLSREMNIHEGNYAALLQANLIDKAIMQ